MVLDDHGMMVGIIISFCLHWETKEKIYIQTKPAAFVFFITEQN